MYKPLFRKNRFLSDNAEFQPNVIDTRFEWPIKCTAGCMKELWVNHKLVDFMNAARQQKVTPGCSLLQDEEQMVEEEGVKPTRIVEQEHNPTMVDEEQVEPQEGPVDEDDEDEDEDEDEENDPCYNNQCHKGSKCEPRGIKDYTCKCQPGWSGKYCTQGKIESVIKKQQIINNDLKNENISCDSCELHMYACKLYITFLSFIS